MEKLVSRRYEKCEKLRWSNTIACNKIEKSVWARDCWEVLSDNTVWIESLPGNENSWSLTLFFAFRHFDQEKAFESKTNGKMDDLFEYSVRHSMSITSVTCHREPNKWSRDG